MFSSRFFFPESLHSEHVKISCITTVLNNYLEQMDNKKPQIPQEYTKNYQIPKKSSPH